MTAQGRPPARLETPDPVLEQRLAVALDLGGIGSWELMADEGRLGSELRGDARTRELFGLSVGAGTNPTVSTERVLEQDRREAAAGLRRAVAEGCDVAAELRVRLEDGSLRWVAVRGRPLYDAQGRLERVVGSVVDLSAGRAASRRADEVGELLALVATASELLASSLEPEDAVSSFARLVVPRLADWSVLSLVGADGRLHDAHWFHRDPRKADLLAHFAAYRLADRQDSEGSLRAFTTRQPFLVERGAREYAMVTLRSPEAIDAIGELELESVAVFPLLSGSGQVLGVITLARGPLRSPLDADEVAAMVDLCHRVSTALENARTFDREREMSEQLQRSLLTDPVTPDDLEVAVRYRPGAEAAQVGGDWYDAFPQGDASVLVVGDVVGHDSVAAAVMGQLRSMLRGIAVTTDAGPGDLLGALDRAMARLQMWTTATVVAARVDRVARADRAYRLCWSNAGHPPPLLAGPAGEVTVLDEHDALLGVDADRERADHILEVEPGSTLVFYTDGLVERRGLDLGDRIEQLRKALAAAARPELGLGPDDVIDRLLKDLLAEETDDDVVVLAVRLADHSSAPGGRVAPDLSTATTASSGE